VQTFRQNTERDGTSYGRTHEGFPNEKTILRAFRSKENKLRRLAEFANANSEYGDIAAMLADVAPAIESDERATKEGLVYLMRSGAHYKIGKSADLERRVKEIRIALPEAATLVHAIRTDDPSGIEAYWHRRFADRRAKGEWFKLTHADVAAFKRRKYQ
jgi:Meiotically up-regulated gene 113